MHRWGPGGSCPCGRCQTPCPVFCARSAGEREKGARAPLQGDGSTSAHPMLCGELGAHTCCSPQPLPQAPSPAAIETFLMDTSNLKVELFSPVGLSPYTNLPAGQMQIMHLNRFRLQGQSSSIPIQGKALHPPPLHEPGPLEG